MKLEGLGNIKTPTWTDPPFSSSTFHINSGFSENTCVTFIFRKEFLKDYTFADAHLLTRVTSYYGEVITNMFLVLGLRILEIWAFPSGRHVMIHGPLDGPLSPIYTEPKS